MGKAINLYPYLRGEGELAPARFFVFQTDVHPKFPGQMGSLSLLCRQSALPAGLSAQVMLEHRFSGVLARFCIWVGLGGTLNNELGYDSTPLPGYHVGDQSSSGVSKNSTEDLKRQICILLNSLVRPNHHLGSTDEQNCLLDFSLGVAGRTLVCQGLGPRCCMPLPLLYHNQISSGQSPQISLQSS